MTKSQNRRWPAGFTLIEVIGATSVMLLGFIAVETVVQQSLRTVRRSVDGLVAVHLAEEGLELVRSIRDNNRAAGSEWNTNLNPKP